MKRRTLQFLIPGELQSGTGGYVYDRHVIEGLRALGWQVVVHGLDESFPEPSAAALVHAGRILADLPDAALVLVDGLALGAMGELVQAQARRLSIVALVHMPLGAEVGLSPRIAAQRQAQELRVLAGIRQVVVTSRATERLLNAQGLPLSAMAMIEPGTDPAPLARRRYDGTYRLLCVATLTEGKGHARLIEALSALAHLPWQLCCIGSLTRSPNSVHSVRALVQRAGLEARVQLLGELPHAQLSEHFAASDLFVLATYQESYCLAVAEALAHGLPIVSTRTGMIPELVGAGAGILVDPDDTPALQAALARVLEQPALATELADAALFARHRLEPWDRSCAQLAAVLDQVLASAAAAATERAG